MSIKSEMIDLRDEVIKPYMKPVFKAALLFNSGSILEMISDVHLKRNILPEPFDLPDHVGNFREGAMITMGAYAVFGIISTLDKPRALFKRSARLSAVGAFAASAVVQVVGEKYGFSNSFLHNTPDMMDAAYGVGWSAITAVTAYSMHVGIEADLHQQTLEDSCASLKLVSEIDNSKQLP